MAGGLVWDQTEVAIESIEGGGKVPGQFRFTNKSDQPIRIRAVPASCGCIVAKPEKRDYTPGESGIIPFTYAHRVYVVTNEGGAPYEIRLVVTEKRR
jgi:hypothetical protein